MVEHEIETSTLKERAKEKLRRDLGDVIMRALHDPKTVKIMLNADGKLWQGERSINPTLSNPLIQRDTSPDPIQFGVNEWIRRIAPCWSGARSGKNIYRSGNTVG